jgi:hypothetical protein
MLGDHGLAWPWESLHIEALAWFDQWLKGKDTGVLEGPSFRYVVREAEGWRSSDVWPIRGFGNNGTENPFRVFSSLTLMMRSELFLEAKSK